MTTRGRAAALLVAVAAFGAGCSSSGAPTATATNSSSIPVTDMLVQALSSVWTPQHDAMSGVTFRLPGEARRRDRTAADIVQRVYTYAFTDQAAVSVGIADLPTKSKVTAFVDNYAATLKMEFVAGGVKDFAVREQKRSTYRGHEALDMRIVYTPISGQRIPPAWFIRLVVDGLHVVVLQTVGSAPAAQGTFVATCRTLQERLVTMLQF